MAPPSGSAAYKKKDGTLTISQDGQSISWIPAAGGATGTITLSVAQVTSAYHPTFTSIFCD
jgi:transcription initiation factor TFIIH subunit 1